MGQPHDQDRNLPASPRKIKKAREEGQVARSRELGHFTALGLGTLLLAMAAPAGVDLLKDMLRHALRFNAQDASHGQAMLERLLQSSQAWLWSALPVGILLWVFGVLASLVCGGLLWTLKPLRPQWSKLNPISGLGRLLSKHQLIDTFKNCLIVLVLCLVGALFIEAHQADFAMHLATPLPQALADALALLSKGLGYLVGVLALCAALDWPLQHWRLAQQLKMSPAEVKQELREMEGNPEIKGQVKARMRALASRRMLQAVPTADLVVMNPTHYAVALKYDEARMSAPRVVAKGADLLAMKIRDTAQTAEVPILQSPVLARALYAHADLDREIPLALYTAVAQVLAYVYQLRAAAEGRAPSPPQAPVVFVPPELDPHTPKAGRDT